MIDINGELNEPNVSRKVCKDWFTAIKNNIIVQMEVEKIKRPGKTGGIDECKLGLASFTWLFNTI